LKGVCWIKERKEKNIITYFYFLCFEEQTQQLQEKIETLTKLKEDIQEREISYRKDTLEERKELEQEKNDFKKAKSDIEVRVFDRFIKNNFFLRKKLGN